MISVLSRSPQLYNWIYYSFIIYLKSHELHILKDRFLSWKSRVPSNELDDSIWSSLLVEDAILNESSRVLCEQQFYLEGDNFETR